MEDLSSLNNTHRILPANIDKQIIIIIISGSPYTKKWATTWYNMEQDHIKNIQGRNTLNIYL